MDRVLRIVPVPAERAPDAADTPDDSDLVAGLRAGASWAAPALVARYGSHMRRVLLRVLGGSDSEIADVLQDVTMNAWQGISGLADPRALKSWLTQIAVFTARKAIRRRHRRRWLVLFDHLPETDATTVGWAGQGNDLQEAAGCVYRIFDRMPVDERLPFALRMLEGLDLDATAAACGMSVATVRRRLARAERRFFKMAREFEALAPWLREAR